MKAQLGRPTGLALALLATLLATFLAMGAFSVALAQTQPSPSAERSFFPTEVALGGEVVISIDIMGENDEGIVRETLPEGFSLVSHDFFGPERSVLQTGNVVAFISRSGSGGVPSYTYTVQAPDTARTFTFSGNFGGKVNGNAFSAAIGGASMFEVVAATNGGNGNGTGSNGGNGESGTGITLSSQEPGAAVQITINASTATAIMPNQDITVDLSAFSVPSTIADSAIDISSDGFDGSPSNVVVNGSKVTMTVPNVKANGDDQDENVVGSYGIRIKQSAGVTNAASGGEKTVTWVENAPNTDEDANKEATVTIQRVIKLSATAGTRGTETTATLKGFANGSATVNLNDAKLNEVTITDNIGTLEIDTTSSSFKANQDNTITAEDAAGNSENVSATFTISPKLVVDPEETSVSKSVTVKLSDWPLANTITEVKIGAETVTPDSAPITDNEGKASFSVTVPPGANRGTQTVKVTGTDPDTADPDVSAPSATASLKIGVLTLTAQPTMVVPGQQITIQGSGFVANDSFSSVSVGGIAVPLSPAIKASSAGDIVITINVPSPPSGDGIGSGTKTISVAATGSNRVAEGSIEIPKAAITIDPTTSRRGTTVNVSGSGFPSGDLVQVKYENNAEFVTVAAGSADASGAVSIDFVVPSYAKIGSEHKIEATSVGVFKGVTAKATHETPGAMVTLSSDTISSGENITISGMNFPAFATVAVMEIGGVDVRPVPAPATSIDGDFSTTVLVPQLELGNQTVSVRVSQTTITTFLEFGTATVSRVPADVFASLGDRLVRVWFLERATQVWSFYDPDPEIADFNTLSEVSSGQIVTIILTEGGTLEFNSTPSTLYAGTNPVSLK